MWTSSHYVYLSVTMLVFTHNVNAFLNIIHGGKYDVKHLTLLIGKCISEFCLHFNGNLVEIYSIFPLHST